VFNTVSPGMQIPTTWFSFISLQLTLFLVVPFLCRNVLSIDEYTSYFDAIDPLAPYKRWTTKPDIDQNSTSNEMAKRKIAVQTQRVQAAFVVSDSVDWSRDIQVVTTLIDLVLS